MQINIDSLRADTPGCASTNHLNNAGASLPPTPVIDAVSDYLAVESMVGGYEIAADRQADLAAVYANAAALIGGAPENWAFVESATRGWNAAFSALRFSPGDRVLTTKAEYPSNMAGILRACEIQGATVEVAPDDEYGQVDVAALESMLDDRTRVVSLTHVPTQGGLINPAEQVGALLRDTDILYQVDACQSVGQLPVRVERIGCDILSFTGRKFLRGPRGTGMVWANDRALEQMGNPAGIDGNGASWDEPLVVNPGPGAMRFEPYEVFYAGKVGLAAALAYAAEIGMDHIAGRNAELAGHLRTQLAELPGVTVQDKGALKSAIVTFTVDGHEPTAIKTMLRARSINTSVTGAGSARLDFPERNLVEAVRASVHYFNTFDELDALVAAIAELD